MSGVFPNWKPVPIAEHRVLPESTMSAEVRKTTHVGLHFISEQIFTGTSADQRFSSNATRKQLVR
jgi:hypothetical protein